MCALAETFIPRDWQAQIIGDPTKGIPEDKTKFKVVVAHRKGGKTVMALMYLFMKAWQCKLAMEHNNVRVPRFTYIAPTYKQAKDIGWDLLKNIVPHGLLLKKPNETQLEIRLRNRVIINLKGADKEDSLRGPGLHYALMDEYAFMRPTIWDTIIRPELGATGGGAMFIGTPNGRDHFYDAFRKGRDDGQEWKSWSLPATAPLVGFDPDTQRGAAILAPGFLEQTRAEVSEKFYRQEYECEFQDNAGMVFDRVDENVVDEFREYPENGHRYRLGVDPALREDWTVISVIDLTDHKFKYVYRTNKIDLELVLSRIENEARKWTTNLGAPEIIMDTTGMGDPMYESLVSRGLINQPVKLNNTNKRLMVDNLAMMFNQDKIKIPRYEWLVDELKDYRYSRSESTGKYFYGAPQGKHDDGVCALFLACYQLPPIQSIQINRRQPDIGIYNPFTGVLH
jgi:hypothetical protein